MAQYRSHGRSIYVSPVLIYLLAILVVLLVVFQFFKGTGLTPGAEFIHAGYGSVVVHEGDTLWSIALDNGMQSQDEINDFIDEVCELNLLNDTIIYTGQRLTIPIKLRQDETLQQFLDRTSRNH